MIAGPIRSHRALDDRLRTPVGLGMKQRSRRDSHAGIGKADSRNRFGSAGRCYWNGSPKAIPRLRSLPSACLIVRFSSRSRDVYSLQIQPSGSPWEVGVRWFYSSIQIPSSFGFLCVFGKLGQRLVRRPGPHTPAVAPVGIRRQGRAIATGEGYLTSAAANRMIDKGW